MQTGGRKEEGLRRRGLCVCKGGGGGGGLFSSFRSSNFAFKEQSLPERNPRAFSHPGGKIVRLFPSLSSRRESPRLSVCKKNESPQNSAVHPEEGRSSRRRRSEKGGGGRAQVRCVRPTRYPSVCSRGVFSPPRPHALPVDSTCPLIICCLLRCVSLSLSLSLELCSQASGVCPRASAQNFFFPSPPPSKTPPHPSSSH